MRNFSARTHLLPMLTCKDILMNQEQSELRLARSLIAERDSEIQLVGTTNNQYVEENERLRAILGEWSNRSAKTKMKLERALEVERMSNPELQRKISMQRNQSHTLQKPLNKELNLLTKDIQYSS
ncbi:unnamed protein product [Lupinus luteus]|uniref:Death domain-containing protein n=1 Tax=Lupinus luteus TaxID=3873 RepID=A0AAV1XET0_LUPLU